MGILIIESVFKECKFNTEKTFTYGSQNRLMRVWLGSARTGASAYDCYGRMTDKTADGQPVFSSAVFDATKVHALASATTTAGLFPLDAQSITYTGFDKVAKVVQGDDSVCFAYGHDRQRILMEEHAGGLTRAKQYWGACEYVTESDGGTSSSRWLTFLTGPYGVFAVVESRNGVDETHYVLKDNLGSWTAITDAKGTVEQRLSYDAWGNLRNPQTWANYTSDDTFHGPMFDRGYTGHEHLTSFGLINMNGRMYDPVMSTFLSADRFVQNPMTAMGFNRYAYCMFNPLKYTDPTGWLAGGGGGSGGSLPHVIIGGQTNYILPEVTIKPDDNPSLSNTPSFWEFYYTPHPGGGNPPFVNAGNEPSLKPSSGGGGSGSHGGVPTPKTPGEIPPEGTTIHTGNFLFIKAWGHYQFGRGDDFWVDASTLDLDYISQKDLIYYENGTASINLFDYSKTDQAALVLGKIDLIPLGNNQYEIRFDKYDFNIEWDQSWSTRNIGTVVSGFLNGPVIDNTPIPTHWMGGKPCYAQPSVYFGGPFEIHFSKSVYIKP